jgi:peptidoglycan/LPS O-acetylase OafA/YrhL
MSSHERSLATPRGGPRREPGPARWLLHGTVPSLDGLRALSILLVLLGHVGMGRHSPLAWLPRAEDVGVEMFFVISGFLITLLLERERRRTGTVSLRAFYVRRCLRIVPAYAFFLLSLYAAGRIFGTPPPPRDWVAVLSYTSNVALTTSWDLKHTWSLSVEEQFYLVWPMLFLLLGRRRAGLVCLAVVAAGPGVRAALDHFWFAGRGGLGVKLFALGRADCLAAGCCLAIAATAPGPGRLLRRCVRRPVLLVLVAAALLALAKAVPSLGAGHRWAFVYDAYAAPSAHCVLMAALLWGCVHSTGSPLYRLLNSGPARFVGVLSYGLYLWQQPFTNPDATRWVCRFPLNVAAALLMACLSYTLIESPFLRLKRRFSSAA